MEGPLPLQNSQQESDNYNTAGPGSMAVSSVVALLMIAATALLLQPVRPGEEFGTCISIPAIPIPYILEVGINTLLIVIAVVLAFFFNKKYSFVRSTEAILPTTMLVVLASNPVNTSYALSPMALLIVNLVCLEIMMRSYGSENATTSMFAVATWLSLGTMLQYSFLPFIVVYLLMAAMIKVLRLKEFFAYLMGLVAPYWVALGLGLVSFSDFRPPRFLAEIPFAGEDYLLFIYISLGTLLLVGFMMMVNNAMLIYAGNMRVRTFNNLINLLGMVSVLCMLADFDNFCAYAPSLSFAVSVQIANFFAMRRIEHSNVWFWSLLSLFIAYFCFMLIEALV